MANCEVKTGDVQMRLQNDDEIGDVKKKKENYVIVQHVHFNCKRCNVVFGIDGEEIKIGNRAIEPKNDSVEVWGGGGWRSIPMLIENNDVQHCRLCRGRSNV